MADPNLAALVDSLNLTPGLPVFFFQAPSGVMAVFQFLVNEQDKRIAADITWIGDETLQDQETLTAHIQVMLGNQLNAQVQSYSSSASEASGKIDHFLRTGIMD